jgi:hypothetical protein
MEGELAQCRENTAPDTPAECAGLAHLHPVPYAIQVSKGKRVNVELIRPDPSDTCSIMQETISDIRLDFLPKPFLADYPAHTAMRLGCGHVFHAMALTYNWARNRNVLCPVCRNGPLHSKILMGRLPREWRYSINRRVRRELHADMQEQEMADIMNLMRFQAEEMPSFFFALNAPIETRQVSDEAHNVNFLRVEATALLPRATFLFSVSFKITCVADGCELSIPCALFPHNDVVLFVAVSLHDLNANADFRAKCQRGEAMTVSAVVNLSNRDTPVFAGVSEEWSWNRSSMVFNGSRGFFEIQGDSDGFACVAFATSLANFVEVLVEA